MLLGSSTRFGLDRIFSQYRATLGLRESRESSWSIDFIEFFTFSVLDVTWKLVHLRSPESYLLMAALRIWKVRVARRHISRWWFWWPEVLLGLIIKRLRKCEFILWRLIILNSYLLHQRSKFLFQMSWILAPARWAFPAFELMRTWLFLAAVTLSP